MLRDVEGWTIMLAEISATLGLPVGDRRVAETTLPSGIWVSTVRLPVERGELRFETMAFSAPEEPGGLGEELDVEGYATKDEARVGHARMVAKWTRGSPDAP